jgi:hypothetical protein
MLVSFRPDTQIAFNDLVDGRLIERDIEIEVGKDIRGNASAILRWGEATVLVRSDNSGNVSRLIPTSQDQATLTILSRVGAATGAAFDAITEDAGEFLEYEA